MPESRAEFLARVADEHYAWEGRHLDEAFEPESGDGEPSDHNMWHIDMSEDPAVQQEFMEAVGEADYEDDGTDLPDEPDIDLFESPHEQRPVRTIHDVMQALIRKDVTFEEAKGLLSGIRLELPPKPTLDELWARSSGYADDPEPGPNEPFWLENAHNLGAITNAQREELANATLR